MEIPRCRTSNACAQDALLYVRAAHHSGRAIQITRPRPCSLGPCRRPAMPAQASGTLEQRITNQVVFCLSFKDFIYLFMRDIERETDTQAEGEAVSMQGARCGTWSWVSRITPWAEGGAKPLSHPGCPTISFKNKTKIQRGYNLHKVTAGKHQNQIQITDYSDSKVHVLIHYSAWL